MKNAQRSILMKTTVSYNIKKVLAGTILAALPFAFGGCEKENTKPENSESQTVTHKFEYNKNMKFNRPGTPNVIPHDVFVNDSLPALLNNQNTLVILDPVESEQFLNITTVNGMNTRAEMMEQVCEKGKNKIKAGNKTVEILASVYTDDVKRVFENMLGAHVVTR